MPQSALSIGSDMSSAGFSVAAVGDFNGDGLTDFVVGGPYDTANTGSAYLIYGDGGGVPATTDLADLDPQDGFEISGDTVGGLTGFAVAAAGDINGDGFGDVLVSAPGGSADYIYTYTRFDGYTRFYSTYIPITYTYTYTGYTTYGASYTEQRTYQAGYTYFSSYYYGTAIQYFYTETRANAGGAFVIFGTDAQPAMIDTAALGDQGLQILGAYDNDMAGLDVAGVADFNGDGIDDVALGASEAGDVGRGRVYVVFGDDQDLPDAQDLQGMSSADGVVLTTQQVDSGFGMALAASEDINGDGFGDIAVGAANADVEHSYTYTRTDGYTRFYSTYIPVTYTYTYTGYTTYGEAYTDQRTYVGGYYTFSSYYYGFTQTYTYTSTLTEAGQVYVFFGSDGPPQYSYAAEGLDGANGFTFSGRQSGDHVGSDVAMIGDVNGDGIADILIGASGVDGSGAADVGAAYVVFGQSGSGPANLTADDLNSSLGFVIQSDGAGRNLGRTVSGVGDVNGDGLDDMMVVDTLSDGSAGRAHLIFGQSGTSLQSGISLGDLDGTSGFTFHSDGTMPGGNFGVSVSGGDLNGDGKSDILIGSSDGTTGVTRVINGGLTALRIYDRLDGALDGQIDMTYLTDPYVIGSGQNDVLSGAGSDAIMYGFWGDDDLSGKSGNDTILAGNGNDTVSSGSGDDLAKGGRGADIIKGGSGEDTIIAGDGADELRGGSDNDLLMGGRGDDTLFGGDGEDTLDGGSGSDFLTGKSGADTFVFASDSVTDEILDFEVGLDVIDLSRMSVTVQNFLIDYQVDGSAQVFVASELLVVRGANGTVLDAVNFTSDDFVF